MVMFNESNKRIKDVVTVARVFRFLRLIKIVRQFAKLLTVSGKRYKKDGFNLDLTYITPQCIAMSLPAVGVESNYRNPIEEVSRFFNTMHADNYLIVNLCSERQYDSSYFRGQVELMPCEAHNPPTLTQLISFMERMAYFVEEDASKVVAVHCKVIHPALCAWIRPSFPGMYGWLPTCVCHLTRRAHLFPLLLRVVKAAPAS